MTLIHTHIKAPMYGFLKIKGMEPKMIRVTRISLMIGLVAKLQILVQFILMERKYYH